MGEFIEIVGTTNYLREAGIFVFFCDRTAQNPECRKFLLLRAAADVVILSTD